MHYASGNTSDESRYIFARFFEAGSAPSKPVELHSGPGSGYSTELQGVAYTFENPGLHYVEVSPDDEDESSGFGYSIELSGEWSQTPPVAAPPPAPPVKVVAPKIRLALAGSRLKLPRHSVAVRIGCAHASCSGSIELVRQTSTKSEVFAKATYSLVPNQVGRIVLDLTAQGRRMLAHAPGHRLAATLLVDVDGGKAVKKRVLLVALPSKKAHSRHRNH
ncbi:MAG TPA: hypothetical protein VGF95_16610 [Solirubrobacteraceae bacterium]